MHAATVKICIEEAKGDLSIEYARWWFVLRPKAEETEEREGQNRKYPENERTNMYMKQSETAKK